MRLKHDFKYSVEPNDTTKVAKFHDFQGKEHACQVTMYSATGAVFIMKDGSLIFKIGDVIPDFRFYSMDKEIYKGSATMVQIKDTEGENLSLMDCSLMDGLLDVFAIVKVDKVTKLQNELLDFIRSMTIQEELDPEFVNLTSQLRYILKGFKEKIQLEELKIKQEEDEDLKPVLLETLRNMAFEFLFDEINRYCEHFTKITSRFTDQNQHLIHRMFFQKNLNDEFFLHSKLFHRAYTKPLGYAGDFEMMNIIYRNQFEGDDIFSQVMSKIDCEGSAAKAVRNRRTFLFEKIGALVKNTHTQEKLKIMSVACGPTVELSDFLSGFKGKKLPTKITFIAIDQDTNALTNARSRIDPLSKDRDDIEILYLEENIKRLIVGGNAVNNYYTDIDLIYSIGLFDYLSERASNKLIHKLYTFLKPGGIMIIGNFGIYNPQRFKMEYGSEWFLLHRSEEEIKNLASGLPENAQMWIEREPEGVNLFLNIKKPLD